jgi:hypothetical protein
MNTVEKLLLKALNDISDFEASTGNGIPFIKNIIDKVTIDYHNAVMGRKDPIQWNPAEPPQDARNCKDHPAVRNTDYMEVHHLTGTSGCSPKYPHWTWPVLGVIESGSSKQLVVPGDWIFEPIEGQYVIISAIQYSAIFGEQPSRLLNCTELHCAATWLRHKHNLDNDKYRSQFAELVEEVGLKGGDELTPKQLESILMRGFAVDRADLIEAYDAYLNWPEQQRK